MTTRGFITLGILCTLLTLLVGVSWAHMAQDSSVDRQVIASGGTQLEQGAYSLDNTLGQPVVGSSSEGDTAVCVGFWCQSAVEYTVYVPVILKDV